MTRNDTRNIGPSALGSAKANLPKDGSVGGYVVQIRHEPLGLQAPRYETFSVVALDWIEALALVRRVMHLDDETTIQVVRILSSEEISSLALKPLDVKRFP